MGAGNRSGFRACIRWLAKEHPEWVEANINLIPEYGRWDDFKALYGTPVGKDAFDLWAEAIHNDKHPAHILACKWAKRDNKALQHALHVNEAGLRKILASRKNHIVEHKMCSNEWKSIDYKQVPSLAMARYTKAFTTHDEKGFEKYKKSLEKAIKESPDEVRKIIHAETLYPHNCLRTAMSGDATVAEAQFLALPDYMKGTGYRIMTICDFSGSMIGATTDGSTSRLEICKALGLYCSDRLGKDNPFYRKFIEFSDDFELIDWKNLSFVDAVRVGNGNCASTNIEKALMGILSMAQMFNATKDQVPNVFLILSDLQFDQGASHSSDTVVETCMKKWENAGYAIPKIIYWNLAGYEGEPATIKSRNVALVSGFSPSVMTAVLGGKDFSPMAVLKRAVEKYKIAVPGAKKTRRITLRKIKAKSKIKKLVDN